MAATAVCHRAGIAPPRRPNGPKAMQHRSGLAIAGPNRDRNEDAALAHRVIRADHDDRIDLALDALSRLKSPGPTAAIRAPRGPSGPRPGSSPR